MRLREKKTLLSNTCLEPFLLPFYFLKRLGPPGLVQMELTVGAKWGREEKCECVATFSVLIVACRRVDIRGRVRPLSCGKVRAAAASVAGWGSVWKQNKNENIQIHWTRVLPLTFWSGALFIKPCILHSFKHHNEYSVKRKIRFVQWQSRIHSGLVIHSYTLHSPAWTCLWTEVTSHFKSTGFVCSDWLRKVDSLCSLCWPRLVIIGHWFTHRWPWKWLEHPISRSWMVVSEDVWQYSGWRAVRFLLPTHDIKSTLFPPFTHTLIPLRKRVFSGGISVFRCLSGSDCYIYKSQSVCLHSWGQRVTLCLSMRMCLWEKEREKEEESNRAWTSRKTVGIKQTGLHSPMYSLCSLYGPGGATTLTPPAATRLQSLWACENVLHSVTVRAGVKVNFFQRSSTSPTHTLQTTSSYNSNLPLTLMQTALLLLCGGNAVTVFGVRSVSSLLVTQWEKIK